jgi:hypothetical protein
LAEAAGLSLRAVSDLERGIHRTARKDTALLLTRALGLTDSAATAFVAAARGHSPAADVLTAVAGSGRRSAATMPRVKIRRARREDPDSGSSDRVTTRAPRASAGKPHAAQRGAPSSRTAPQPEHAV